MNHQNFICIVWLRLQTWSKHIIREQSVPEFEMKVWIVEKEIDDQIQSQYKRSYKTKIKFINNENLNILEDIAFVFFINFNQDSMKQ